jgi:competence protein ComFC
LKATFRRLASSWGKLAEVLLYPSFCEICHKFLDNSGEKVICLSCREKIKPWASSYCLCCGRVFVGAGEPQHCRDCLERTPPYARHRSCARYEGTVKDVILLYKYRGFEVLGDFLGDFVARATAPELALWPGVEAIIPVPLHPARKRERGFNQSQVLAGRLSKIRNIRLEEKRLVKVKNVPPQTTLAAKDREKNVRGAFRLKKTGDLEGKVVLLVDDVFTTGSTIRECSSVLRKAGVKEVRAVTVAQA